MLILGIDPGFTAGWALIDEHGALDSFACVETEPTGKAGDNQRRLAALLKAVTVPMRKASVVGIEFPSIGIGQRPGDNAHRARWTAKSMGQTAAAASVVMGFAFGLGGQRRIFTPAPITWRSSLDPDADEEELHAAFARRYPLIADMRSEARPHVFDGLGVALYCRQFVQPATETQETAA